MPPTAATGDVPGWLGGRPSVAACAQSVTGVNECNRIGPGERISIRDSPHDVKLKANFQVFPLSV